MSRSLLFCLLIQIGFLHQVKARAVLNVPSVHGRGPVSTLAIHGDPPSPASGPQAKSYSLAVEDLDPGTPLRHPYVASLRNLATGAYLCGGALVAAEYVATAAQCVQNTGLVFVEIGFGSITTHEKIAVVDILLPQLWHGDVRRGHDIALLKLESPSKASPVRVPPSSPEIANRESLNLLSRGRTSSYGSFTDILQLGKVDFIPTSECSATGILGGLIQPGMMCLGGGSACLGDEGSPVVRLGSTKEKDLLLGIASFAEGQGCGDLNTVGIYTKVDAYRDWIYSII